MTIVELLGGAAGAVTAAYGGYRMVIGKLEAVIGKKDPADVSLRDVVLRLEGKLDAHREHSAAQAEAAREELTATREDIAVLGRRVRNLEDRVFTPPARRAFRSRPGE